MASDDGTEPGEGIASRRGFLGGGLLLAGTALALAAPAGAAAARAPVTRARRPVVAYHADQLYLDHSGAADAYAPPAGLRTLDGHDEAALRHLVYAL